MLKAAGSALDVATWHLYIAYGLDPKLKSLAWDPAEMQKIGTTAAGILSAVSAAAFQGEVWVGESAFAWHSGQAGVTDTFLSAPWWMSALGQLSPTHAGFCRQTLIGGNYVSLARPPAQNTSVRAQKRSPQARSLNSQPKTPHKPLPNRS